MSSESEGIAHSDLEVHISGGVRHVIEVTFFIGGTEVCCGCDFAILYHFGDENGFYAA